MDHEAGLVPPVQQRREKASVRFFKRVMRLSPLVLLTIFVTLLCSDCSSERLLYESKQPEDISYGSYDPYVLQCRTGPTRWNHLFWPSTSTIFVTRLGNEQVYGHQILIDTGSPQIRETEWTSEGISVRFESGHDLFIPKIAFIGGR